MVLSGNVLAPTPTADNVPLFNANPQEMVALTTLAFLGFFRSRTCEMGSYHGVRSPSGELIAMAGERLQLDGYFEISAVWTPVISRPRFSRQPYLALGAKPSSRRPRLLASRSCANHRAVKLYLGMGFQRVRRVTLYRRITQRLAGLALVFCLLCSTGFYASPNVATCSSDLQA
jgi:hypothetical protein